MVQKESWVYITDNTNIKWVKLFQLYKGSNRKSSKPGFIVKGSARVVEPPRLEYKGFKYKYNIKGDIVKLLLVRSNLLIHNKSRFSFFLKTNAAIVIKKKLEPKSKFLNGPIARSIYRRKVSTLFKATI